MIYASLRRPIILPLRIRLIMRIVPIIMFTFQIFSISAAMRCQTSLQFRGGKANTSAPPTNSFFHAIGKAGTWWMDDRQVCEAIGMIPDSKWGELAANVENPEADLEPPSGSLEILWPLYKTLSLSQFVEAFSCALMGRTTATETGMTLLEHSLAFAEAEAMSHREVYHIDLIDPTGEEENKSITVKGRPLVTVEVLYICLISSLSHLVSHALAVFNLQARFRLVSTGLFGLAFLGGFAFSLALGGSQAILEYPTVSVVGFIPHLLIFSGIAVCGVIYGLALFLSSLFPPSGQRSFHDGFNNLRANLTFSSVNVSLGEDFYTTLLKLGFMCLTAASEATYLNEGHAVRIPGWTWLEAERNKLRDSHRSLLGVPRDAVVSEVNNPPGGTGPYARERKDLRGMVAASKTLRSSSRTARWTGAAEILKGVGIVLGRIGFGSAARLFGLRTSSRASTAESEVDSAAAQLLEDANHSGLGEEEYSEELYHRFLRSQTPLPDVDMSGDFIPSSPLHSRQSTPFSPSSPPSSPFSRSFSTSFSYPISAGSSRASSLAPESDGEYDSESSNLTVTPHSHSQSLSQPFHRHQSPSSFPRSHHDRHRTPTPQPTISEIFPTPSDLARLLDPQTPEDRATARMLAHHLKSDTVLTRRGFRSVVLPPLAGVHEEEALEEVLLARRKRRRGMRSRRRRRRRLSDSGGDGEVDEEDEEEEAEDDEEEDEDDGRGGPLCVVCYSAPRTIIVWPCRCLSLCEDCRVCLAMKNFANCVTCRQKSEGFSRIYIP